MLWTLVPPEQKHVTLKSVCFSGEVKEVLPAVASRGAGRNLRMNEAQTRPPSVICNLSHTPRILLYLNSLCRSCPSRYLWIWGKIIGGRVSCLISATF